MSDNAAPAPHQKGHNASAELLALYRLLVLIRRSEERVSTMFADGEVPGFIHLSIGQEAVSAGVMSALTPEDTIASTHRGHGHAIAKGLSLDGFFAELLARETGLCKGRGGSMHVADMSVGMLGANGIVGAGLSIALGSALAHKTLGNGAIAVAFFGDGALAEGLLHECMNLAALWKLPLLFVCENNGWGEFLPTSQQLAFTLKDLATAYKIEHRLVDGNDVGAVADAASRIAGEVRTTGPRILECMTTRVRGHFEGDAQKYRDADDLAAMSARDPLKVAAAQLAALGVDAAALASLASEVEARIEAAVAAARAAPFPPFESAMTDVYTGGLGVSEMRYIKAINLALSDGMAADSRVILFGEDIGEAGGPFGASKGLRERFGAHRVLDTPISEAALAGAAVGAAMSGLKPVVEIMFMDFTTLVMDAMVNQAAKAHFMFGGQRSVPMVLRTPHGGGLGAGPQHSQCLEAWFAHIPGLKVVCPSDAASAYGLLRAAIDDPDPVVFVENKALYALKCDVPDDLAVLPLGKAATLRAGRDVTIVAYGAAVHTALAAAATLAETGVDAEVIDLRTVQPWDENAVLTSLARTHRLVVVHEAVEAFGVGAEIVARMADIGFDELDGPIVRVGAPFMPVPFSTGLETAYLPSAERIITAVHRTLA